MHPAELRDTRTGAGSQARLPDMDETGEVVDARHPGGPAADHESEMPLTKPRPDPLRFECTSRAIDDLSVGVRPRRAAVGVADRTA